MEVVVEPQFRFTLLRLLAATISVAVAFLLLSVLSEVVDSESGLTTKSWWLLIGTGAALGATIGILRSGPQGFILGAIAGLVIGTLLAYGLIVMFLVRMFLTGGQVMPVPN